MQRDGLAYVVLHYVLMIGLIFAIVGVVDRTITEVSLLLGIAIAVVVGVGYPMLLRSAGVAPKQWS